MGLQSQADVRASSTQRFRWAIQLDDGLDFALAVRRDCSSHKPQKYHTSD
jgi:hypothetical protein